MDLNRFRKDYRKGHLSETELPNSPFDLFGTWFQDAIDHHPTEPNPMTLATVGPDGQPHTRIVLLKGWSENGFVLYSNYRSQKGQDIAQNAKVALQFYWPTLERQIRIQGVATQQSELESAAYFATRPRESQLAAWASAQSESIADRAELEQELRDATERFEGQNVPKPPHWGGYVVTPDRIEFWQGGAARLHDRICYQRESQSAEERWVISRLSP